MRVSIVIISSPLKLVSGTFYLPGTHVLTNAIEPWRKEGTDGTPESPENTDNNDDRYHSSNKLPGSFVNENKIPLKKRPRSSLRNVLKV